MKGGETFYDILGVEEKCSQDDIKKAYRKLSFINHPDKNGNSQESTEKFQKISEAFSILGDPDERMKYDITRSNPFAGLGEDVGGGGVGAAAASLGMAEAVEAVEADDDNDLHPYAFVAH